ncbi:hypothetical protein [Ferrimonas sp. SCSIO 43195]|uniref:hypothetical protein n=1 Tax=Ferrimonas sp. SCSIO 43195 TaxID=2822844 RepID=UPI002075DFDF|nr:hypothetical protein [Ferrimonas sp. SCSIO 43195]USD37113.1 hypothetical protein J8Z22_19345 [Ferrimonas sp. SCSIO 43195]
MRFPYLLLLLVAGCQAPMTPEQAELHQARMARQSAIEQQAPKISTGLGQREALGAECEATDGSRCVIWGELPVGSGCRCDGKEGMVR